VKLPNIDDPVLPEIANNPKWFPYFKDAIGAMDGTHINCCPSATDRVASRNRKGGITMNTICCCSLSMEFQHVTSGWEGSAADASIYNDARLQDLYIPEGKYYLADAGFGICNALRFPTAVFATIWQNGDVQVYGLFQFLWSGGISDNTTDLPTVKSSTTCVMCAPGMSLSAFLGW
jgi:hypothetical protein